ncbi:glycosyltransferase family 2 protein [Ulvibacter antarcticus]|uniref:Cellulose synthase/poly-beta-1,6-N-acetylglucosamine synthase-like glycosyltransferase n=1 Tax=Ulvibacter antarcticus TaxID=442714 RepID=A0A3L9Z0B1_9FLAO|nr:glycosyltransferase [Ulvibacter antarcticus]RMA66401.1 cellulose synthase/poly-beta-1,6-N-acetylglucosamine synthase-like glycosyltransferase [Ulvibacter antarcticus]
MIYLFCFLIVAYCIALIVLLIGFFRLSIYSSEGISPQTHFSVLIPFRNEAKNLPKLLKSISNLDYPIELFEFIFIDDASTDASEAIIQTIILEQTTNKNISFRIIKNQRHSASPKKDAITAAITISKHEWILTTDADCELPKNWLRTFDAYIQENNPMMITAPVRYESNDSLLEEFQKFDGLSLQGVTIGSFALGRPLLCNGANLGYKKSVFNQVKGFIGNDHIASGDDVFLMEKFIKHDALKVCYLKSKDAIVVTQPQKSWEDVINQRIRWASKTSKQKNPFSTLLGLLVFLANVFLLIIPVYCLYRPQHWTVFIVFLVLKLFMDYIVLKTTAGFFGTKINLLRFILSALSYPMLVIRVVLGSISGTYEWKGRKFEKQA